MFKSRSIGTRIAVCVTFLLLLLTASVLIGVWQINAVVERGARLVAGPLAKERIMADWYRLIETGSKRTVAVAVSDDPRVEEIFGPESKAANVTAGEYQAKFLALGNTEEEKVLLKEMAGVRRPYIADRVAIFELRRQGKGAEALALYEKNMKGDIVAYLDLLSRFTALERKTIDSLARANAEDAERATWEMLALGACAILLGGVFSLFIVRGIVHPLRQAVTVADQVAAGDLSADFSRIGGDRKDETGLLLKSLGRMAGNLRETVGAIKLAADAVGGAAGEIAQGNHDLSGRTEEQASALEETAASMEEMTATVTQNADNARTASQLVTEAAAVAVRGGHAVREVVGTMNGITDASRRIADIIGVIDGIAFQTNILALNAAVEAARAGEQGRGFAVVASEVRSLAQRAAAAAKEIKTLIGDSVAQVDTGSRQVEEAGKTVDQIVAAVNKVSALVTEIAAASREQAQGIEQVSETITQLEKVTQQNAAMVEEASAASASLEDQAGQLVMTVSVFRTGDGGEGAPPARVAPAPRLHGAPVLDHRQPAAPRIANAAR